MWKGLLWELPTDKKCIGGIIDILLVSVLVQPTDVGAIAHMQKPSSSREETILPPYVCQSFNPRGGGKTASGFQFNVVYAAIVGAYGLLFLLKNPYIFATLSVLTIIPQNSAITSLNSLVILFYDSGLFMNFAEAVYCVRLMTWLSIACTLVAFAVFS